MNGPDEAVAGADGASATSTTTAQASSNRTPRWPPRRRDRGVPLHGKDAEKPWADVADGAEGRPPVMRTLRAAASPGA